MNRKFVVISIGILVIFCGALFTLYFWIGRDVKENISIAQSQYPGAPESALISFLQDENNSFNKRTHIAIWTLGHIQSRKALPLLYKLYKNDPEGKTCYGHHDIALCQYEIHKAIDAIEEKKLFTYARLK